MDYIKIINIVLLVLFTLAWNEYDFIIFQKRFSIMNIILKNKHSRMYEWYFTNNWQLDNWITKNVLPFLRDGMHLNSSIYRFIAYFYFAQLMFYNDWIMIGAAIGLYMITGLIHSIWNKTI